MRHYRLSVSLLAIVLLTGCITGRINDQMNSWVGHPVAELVMAWGPPQAVYDDGQGGRIVVYTNERKFTTAPATSTTSTTFNATVYNNDTILGQAQSITTYNPAQTSGYTAYRIFQVDQNGRIYNFSWRGL
jgi:hypothetical protein